MKMREREGSPSGENLRLRCLEFATRIVKLVQALPSDTAGTAIGRQVIRSGTSVGANVEEAHGAHSQAEFARRMGIARSEARETLYWIRLIAATRLVKPARVELLEDEAEQLLRILTTIVKKVRK